jgi:hypothetical protein
MIPRFEKELSHLQARYGDRMLSALTILLLLIMFVIAPLLVTGSVVVLALGGVVFLSLIAGALVVSGNALVFLILSIAFCLNLAVVILRLLHEPVAWHLCLLASAWLIFATALSWIVGKAVFGPGRVTYHRIVGSVLLYLMISLTFSALFILVGVSIPNAISGITFEDRAALTSTVFYFSFVTLTSTGYGDILPVHPIARSLCNVETILGQLYPATLLARLVTLEIEGRR